MFKRKASRTIAKSANSELGGLGCCGVPLRTQLWEHFHEERPDISKRRLKPWLYDHLLLLSRFIVSRYVAITRSALCSSLPCSVNADLETVSAKMSRSYRF